MADSMQTRIWGKLVVSSCTLIGGCRVWFLMHRPFCTLDRWRFGLIMIGMLLAFSASCIFPLWLHASLPWTYNRLFSLISTNCLGLRPTAAMTNGCFLPVQAVSSAGLVMLSRSTTITLSFFSSGSLLKKTVLHLGMCTSSNLVTWLAHPRCTWSKINSLLARLAVLRTSLFDM